MRRSLVALAPLPAWVGLCFACATIAPPRDAEYPAVTLPARFEPESAPARSGLANGANEAPAGAAGAREAGAKPADDAERPTADVPRGSAAPSGATDATSQHGHLPDPPALSDRRQYVYEVAYDRGTISVSSPAFECLDRPRVTARRIGRFAFELWLGRELIERVRFDFPLLASEEPRREGKQAIRETPSFAAGARVSVTLSIPASERANRAQLLDRATGETIEVPWPPAAPAGTDPSRCGAPRAPRTGSAASGARPHPGR